MMMQTKFYIILLLGVFPSFFILLSCGRTDPTSNNNIIIPTLQPISVFSLTISEPSGIAYNARNNSLMIVSDASPVMYETDFSGNVLRTISTSSADLEGIALSKNCDTIYVVEETNKLVTTYSESGLRLASFFVDVATNSKHALEGVSINYSNGHLIVLNEKLPCMILGFDGTSEIWRKELNYSTDISDIFYEQQSNVFWIVSDESQKIMKLDYNLKLIAEWKIPIQQAEGITIINNQIYVVSDAERKLYIFNKP